MLNEEKKTKYRAKEVPIITADVVLNDNIFVVAGKLHLINDEHEFMFNKTWHIMVDDGSFVDLGMGAVPNFELTEKINNDCFDDFFEAIEQEEL